VKELARGVVLIGLLGGCEGPALFSNLARGLVPEADDGYETDGRHLHDGSFHALALEAAHENDDHVLAIDEDSDLLVYALGSESSCWIGDVIDYQPAVWRSLDLDEARLPVVRKTDLGETLFFADFDCQLARVTVPNGRVVDLLPLPDGRGALVEDGEGNVSAVSPWLEQTTLLGRRVLGNDHPYRHSLLVLDGKLVLYDIEAKPVVSVGQDVVGALLLPDAGELLVADSSGGVAAVPVTEDDAQSVWLTDDGCNLVGAGPTGSVAAYYAPCGARRLVLYFPPLADAPAGTEPMASDANEPRIVTRSLALERSVEREVRSAVFFRELLDDRGALWAQTAGEPPYRLLDRALDSWMLAAFDRRRDAQRVVAFALVEDDEESVDLVAVAADQRVPVARRVRSLYESVHSLVLLADGDSHAGDLIVLESRPFERVTLREPELLLSNALAGLDLERRVVLPEVLGVAPLRLEQGSDLLSLVRTGPGSDHALFLLRQSQLDGAFAEPELVTNGIGDSYSFSHNLPDSVLGLVRSGGGSFRLEQFWYEQGLRNTIARDVSTYYESTAPGRLGVVYATAGDAPALYYSSLR
jgi:hypothetical protein